jgi:hypothetical protein
MNKKSGFVLSALMGLLVLSADVSDAFAARMGGGRSFGSRPSFNMPYQRSPSPASPGMNRPGAPAQQPAMSAAQQRKERTAHFAAWSRGNDGCNFFLFFVPLLGCNGGKTFRFLSRHANILNK